ncbi:AAA family ATPase [Chloroflexota bacterium]
MIPIRLALRNFMPYRDNVPPLDFTAIHTASISGANGNGKSALIDAITWALWGKTRAKSDDDLIHQGQDEMEVEFDFSVGQDNYRVIRKRARPKGRRASGQPVLELQISSENGFRSITGNNIRETEKKIENEILHMDYETFINSAFLRQGHADEFTRQPPFRRKEVLSNILGLIFYEELEKRTRELARQRETEKAREEGAIRDIKNELEGKPAYEAELEQAQVELSRIEKVLTEQETGLNELRQKKELLESKQSQLTQLKKHISDNEKQLEFLDNQLKQINIRIEEYQDLIARRSAIEEGYAQYIEAKRLKGELDQKLTHQLNLERQKTLLDNKIRQAGQNLITEHAVVQNKIGQLEASYQKLPQFKTELQQSRQELDRLAGEDEALNQKKKAGQELGDNLRSLDSDKSRLEAEIAEIADKLGLLASQTGAVCPLCERELGEDHHKLIETKYQEEKSRKTGSLELKQEEVVRGQTELRIIIDEISHLETGLNQARTSAQNKVNLLNREIEEVEKAGKQLDEERSRLSELEERLAGKDFAADEQEALGRLEGELARLNYDSRQHEEVRNRLTGLEQYESPRRKLEEADRLINQEKEAADGAGQAAQELKSSLETDIQKIQALSQDLSSLPQTVNDLAQAETEQLSLKAKQRQAQEIVGSVRGRLEHLAEQELKAREREKLLGQVVKEEGIYQELARAFGKNGIQAWLIEMALPELQVEADKLLGRMTDNRMHVRFETQEETKTGNIRDTLDIKISDELGTRDYEMFSGGEAFRIDFAIRIALSKLLARRAGAPLPTLIIDEGFGTQDSTGLEKLKEAITSIQDDFKKIIVITHIEELRDAFPTHIDVIKTAEGSTIEVN